MNYFFITGSSQGLGKSLCELLLQNDNNVIYGFARSCSINHSNYHHTSIDLSDLNKVQSYEFPELEDVKKITLINNAGIVGDVNHVGNVDNQKIVDCYNINLVAPAIFTNNFVAKYVKNEKLVINISSGAGRSPIDGWNAYCSAKAGIDMFSQVMSEEAKINGSNLKVLSLAPGIIDTGMQSIIRSSDKNGFSNVERFIEYKANGDLAAPEQTAQKVFQFISNPELQNNVICSVRDLSN